MSGSDEMTLRVQCAAGTARVNLRADADLEQLAEEVRAALGLRGRGFTLHRGRREPALQAGTLRSLGLRHGDLLFLTPLPGADIFPEESAPEVAPAPVAGTSGSGSSSRTEVTVSTVPQEDDLQEDEVDLILYKQSGKIQRTRDEKLCNHNEKGCCVHCSPLEPWDEDYLSKLGIKHLSFHAHLRKLGAGGKFVSLEEPCYTIKTGCSSHLPWPRGVCSRCQPGGAALARQAWRGVDNVHVAAPLAVERFLEPWRASGQQRVGWLYGRYEPYADVPLGIRAVVSAIWAPAQEGARDAVRLAADEREGALAAAAAALGLRRVGWCFTDLLPRPDDPSKVQCLRGADTHFLSAHECATAAALQARHPSLARPSPAAPPARYGSKFVTVAITGDARGQVSLEGYQVSVQAAALAAAGLLRPTRDAPELAAVCAKDPRQYVPDVSYKERDAYGNEVTVSGARLPVAYLLVAVPVGGAPAGPAPVAPPAELADLPHYLQQVPDFLEAMSSLNALALACAGLEAEARAALLGAVRARDAAAAAAVRDSPAWRALLQLAQALNGATDEGAADDAVWTCPHCTYHNAPRRDHCEMCALPRGNM